MNPLFIDHREGIVELEESHEERSSFLNRKPSIGYDKRKSIYFWTLLIVVGSSCSTMIASNHYKWKKKDHSPIIRFRQDVATAALELMQEDTTEAAANSKFVDIGKLVDIVDEALDTVGVRGVYEQIFGTFQLVVAFNDAARQKGLNKFQVQLTMGHQGFRPFYVGIPNDRKRGDTSSGSIWWLRHWLGAITADKILRDGSLLLGPDSDERIHDAPTLFEEYRRMQRVQFPDILSYHAEHGFDWHFVASTRPDMVEYPADLLGSFCPGLSDVDEYVEVVNNDVAKECRHGLGHAVYYVLAVRQLNIQDQFSVRHQFRPGVGFFLKNETICEGYKVCGQAPTQKAERDCIGGLKHSMRLFGAGDLQQPSHSDLLC